MSIKKNKIQTIEQFAIETMAKTETAMALAHNFDHVNRVRHWALQLAKTEGFADIEVVEATALLHDVGLAHVTDRRQHGEAGAQVAGEFLANGRYFPEPIINQICEAIRHHNQLDGGGKLGILLRDADMLDLFGITGIIRAIASKYHKPEYDPKNPKGETWGLQADAFTHRFQTGKGVGPTIIDQINFQISCFDNLHSQTAQQLAKPQIAQMRQFIMGLETELTSNFLNVFGANAK